MAQKLIKALMWKRVNKSAVDTLTGRSPGQYDIRLTKDAEYEEFFRGIRQENLTENGGYTLRIQLQPFDGPNPVPASILEVRYMGPKSVRQDWNIPSQRPDTAYALWRQGRGLPVDHIFDEADRNFILIVRDEDDQFHARWINKERLATLPERLQHEIESSLGVGVATGNLVSKKAQSVIERLQRHYNVLLYGPPGTGKTYLIQEVISAMTSANTYMIDTTSEVNAVLQFGANNTKIKYEMVTFHQSYSYEDFVISLKPEPSKEMLMNLVPTPGVLLELSEFARVSGNSSLLVIDEINRGNVSRIFGEFITLLEPDKRLDKDGKETASTVHIRLPYVRSGQRVELSDKTQVPNPFTLPLRLYTLATMNSVDKSVAPLDSALRRRFEVVDLDVELESILAASDVDDDLEHSPIELPLPIVSPQDLKKLMVRALMNINERLSFFLGREYCLGHWYLANLVKAESFEEVRVAIQESWDAKILPQLEELFRSRTDQLVSVLRLDTSQNSPDFPVYLTAPAEDLLELGAGPVLLRRDVTFDKFELFLRNLAGVIIQAVPEPVVVPEPVHGATPPENV
jgi:5-methylcytosine-specific restriction enzyme B